METIQRNFNILIFQLLGTYFVKQGTYDVLRNNLDINEELRIYYMVVII